MNEWRIKITDRFGRETWVDNPEGCYLADPFIHGNNLYCEKYDRKKGVIVSADIDDVLAGKPNWEVRVEEDYHVSFPYVEYLDMMIVESGANNTIDEYRLSKGKWSKHKTLVEGVCAADPQYLDWGGSEPFNGHYLFFTNGNDDNLEIWKRDGWEGEFKKYYEGKHKYSRGAGGILGAGRFDGTFYRPVQVNNPHYGYAIQIKEITLPNYTEKVVHEIWPDEGSIGIHTINYDGWYTVTDHKFKV